VPVVLGYEHDDQVMRREASRLTSFLTSVSTEHRRAAT
jgi:hypothetical protein